MYKRFENKIKTPAAAIMRNEKILTFGRRRVERLS